MYEQLFIRWFMVGFFTLLGLWLIAKRDCFANAGEFFCLLRLEEPAQHRLISAYRRRERSEALPSAWMGGMLGALSLIWALLAALTSAPVILLYAINVVVFASMLAFVYVRLRNSTARRYASLEVRDPSATAPWYAWTLVAGTVVLPLAWLPAEPVAASLVTAAGVTTALLARLVASMPAQLSGDDVVVDAFVDTRLRAARVTNLLGTAVAPSLVFESFTGYTDTWLHIGVLLVTIVALITMSLLGWRLLRRNPSQAELSRWSRATS